MRIRPCGCASTSAGAALSTRRPNPCACGRASRPAPGRCCWRRPPCAPSPEDAARSSSFRIIATRPSSRPRWRGGHRPRRSSATTRARARRPGTPPSCGCWPRRRASSWAIGRPSMRPCTRSDSSPSGTTVTRCWPNPSVPGCTPATPPSSGRSWTRAPSSSPGTRAPPTWSASSPSAGCATSPRLAARHRASCSAPRRRASRGAPECRRRRSPRPVRPSAPGLCSCRWRGRATPRCWCAPIAAPPPAVRTAVVRCTRRGAGAVPTCGWCGRQATTWACPKCASERVRMASSGSERTADELGRAFPGIRIIVADGEHPVMEVDARPALVVATRGAEPIADGGYRAVVLLDGDRMLQADDLRIGESCLRWWSNAAALAAPGAPVHLVGVTGAVARALATWTQPAYARAELADRAPLRMPPTVRVAALEGSLPSVEAALATLREAVPSLDAEAILGPVATDAGSPRSGAVRLRPRSPGDREPARLDRRRGAARTQEPQDARSDPRAINSESGSTCPILICEERHAPRLRRHARRRSARRCACSRRPSTTSSASSRAAMPPWVASA